MIDYDFTIEGVVLDMRDNMEKQVTLQPITQENKSECVRLQPREDQLTLVASNADSLIHAFISYQDRE